jgi:peptidoglycan/xylan/chitin deacetylase (PgdA/CDA1 family)
MKNQIKRMLFWFFTTIQGHHFFRFINRKKIVIVMYHGILKENMPVACWWQLPFEKFEWQMEYLKKYYTVMHLRDVMQKIRSREHLPDNVAVITFDDGFANNHSVAYPLLKELNLPATIFLTTDLVGTDRLLWFDELFMLFLETKVNKIDLSAFGLRVFDLTTIPHKQEALQSAGEHLKTLKLDEKKEMTSYIRKALSAQASPSSYSDNFKLLSWEEVDLMNESGLIHWGAHTCTHEILSLLDDKVLNDEIKNSCARISKYGQHLLFAYPNGRKQDFDIRAKIILKQLSALCSLTTISGLNTHSQDPYELKRVGIGHDTTRQQFKLLCSGVI